MMRSIITKGKTIKEAIDKGLEILEAAKKDVDIEIIESASQGIFGIGRKPAVVKLINKTSSDNTIKLNDYELINQIIESEDNKKTELSSYHQHENTPIQFTTSKIMIEKSKAKTNTNDGLVWINDGVVYCKDPQNNDMYPTITPQNGIFLYKNDEQVRGTTIVTEKDQFKIEIENEWKDTIWEITLDQTKMKATLYVKPGYKIERKLIDEEPTRHIELKVNETVLYENTLQSSDIMQRLSQLGVKKGIVSSAITEACEAKKEGYFDIAIGKQPKDGKNGWIEYNLDITQKFNGPLERKDGTVDFRETQYIPSVDKGQTIATVYEPILGSPGATVTGETIPPKPAYSLVIKAGRGIAVVNNGNQIVATETGRPHIQSRGLLLRVSILPKLVHKGNVNLAFGNIRFIGDVEILGDVEHKMKVNAEGDIYIHGAVDQSIITAGNSINIKRNVINSHLTAGKSNMLVSKLGIILGEILDEMEKIMIAINTIINSPAFKVTDFSKKGLIPLLRILLEKKFQTFSSKIKQFYQLSLEGESVLDKEWLDLANHLYEIFIGPHKNNLKNVEELFVLKQFIHKLYDVSKTSPEPNSVITIPYAINSTIYCSGDIFVKGQGCYNSKLFSGGLIKVDGIVRSGEIFGELGVEILEVGAKGFPITKISVPSDKSIKITTVMEDTVIQVGKKKYQFLKNDTNVMARLEDGELILH